MKKNENIDNGKSSKVSLESIKNIITRNKMNYKIDLAPLADYFVVAVKDKNTDDLKDVFTLNKSGIDMLKLLYEGEDIKSVAKKLADIYETSLDVVTVDVIAFANKLRKKGII